MRQMGVVTRPDFCRSILTNQQPASQLLLPSQRIFSHSSNFLGKYWSTIRDSLDFAPVNPAPGSHGLVTTK